MNPLEISPEQFRRLVELVTDVSTQYLEALPDRSIAPAIKGARAEELFSTDCPTQGLQEGAVPALADIGDSVRAQNGRFFGYVLGSGDPVASAADLLAGVLNQNVTAWRSSPLGVVIEQTVVRWLAEAIGCRGFSGSLTGGGSTANLMGLAMAREAKLGVNQSGFGSRQVGIVYASQEAHMSIAKAVALLGLGRANLRTLPVDDDFGMVVGDLERTIEQDIAAGMTPVAIVGSAGTVKTGAIDPLSRLAETAARYHTWFHVDGAYGALAAIAQPEKFRGLELADSVSLDPHKWLYQPLDCGCLLYRNPAAARSAFSQTGDYAQVLSTDPVESFAFFEETIELSRRFRALKLWFSIRYHGMDAFRASIQKNIEQAERLAAAIRAQPELELLSPAILSAVCFRFVGQQVSGVDLDSLNAAILSRVNQRGTVYLSNATLHEKFCLRACIVNHRTTDADIASVIPEVVAAAREITSQPV